MPRSRVILLTVEVQKPTLAFLLGDKWSITITTDIDFHKALSGAWQDIAMTHSAAATYAATAMSDADMLSQLVHCNNTDILPAAVVQSTLAASALEAAPAGVGPLVLLIHALGAAAADILDQPGEGQCTASPTDFLKLDSEMKQSTLQAMEKHDGKERVVASDQQDSVLSLMRCAILLLKIADLTPAAAAEDATFALWKAIHGVFNAFTKHTKPASASTHGQSPATSLQQQQLALALVQLILNALQHSQDKHHQDVWQPPRSMRAQMCLYMLSDLVAWAPAQSAAVSAICTRGNGTACPVSHHQLPCIHYI